MSEFDFFNMYNEGYEESVNHIYTACKQESDLFFNTLPKVPYSNIWIARQLCHKLPKNSQIHFGILNSLRSWDFFNIPEGVESVCNVGGFGIDGCVSSLIGAALASPEKLFFGVVGDLTFYYDSNILLNKIFPNNVRLIVVNNGRGIEFRNYCHPASKTFGIAADSYVAAAGHFGDQINSTIVDLCNTVNAKYYRISSKDGFENIVEEFLNPNTSKSIIVEAITTPEDENHALMTYLQYKVNLDYKIRKLLTKYPIVFNLLSLLRR